MDIRMGFEAEVIITDRGDGYGMPAEYLKWGDYPEYMPYGVRRNIAKELEPIVGDKVTAPKSNMGLQERWAVLPEYDIEFQNYNAIGAVEIISPPLDFDDGLDALKKVFNYVRDNEGFAGIPCGLHINLSLADWKQSLEFDDELKFNTSILIDENKILQHYRRGGSGYTSTHYDHLVVLAASRVLIDPNFDDWSGLGRYIESGKHFATNFKKLERINPYIEFRHIGGEDYLEKFKIIEKDIKYLCKMLTSASKHKSHKPEKIYKNRMNQFVSDVMKTVELVEKINPRIEVLNEESGSGGFKHVMAKFNITTDVGDLAYTNDRGINPTLNLYVPYEELIKYPGETMSPFGAVEMLPIRACYLYNKYRNVTASK